MRLEQSKSQPDLTTIASTNKMTIPEAASDFNQWLHAMKMVARLPGGMPIEFRRKVSPSLSCKMDIKKFSIFMIYVLFLLCSCGWHYQKGI